MALDYIIKNGTVITSSDTFNADIGIQEEKIAIIGTNLAEHDATVIDAKNKYVFPGGIDVHTHLDMPAGDITSKDDFQTGTIAAACGGTTTIVDFCTQSKGGTLQQALAEWQQKARNKAVIDYGFHIAITDMNPTTLQEMPIMISQGCPTFKLYMTYDALWVNDDELLAALTQARIHGGLISVHAENHFIIKYLTEQLKREGKITPYYHFLSRPPLAEAEAVSRAIKLAAIADAPLYIVHLSCNEALLEVKRARKKGAKVMAETCIQYLALAEDKYSTSGFEAAKYVISPPLRSVENQQILLDGLKQNLLQTVASDHCPFDYKGQKERGRDFFAQIPNGGAGIEARMMLLFERGVNTKAISLNRFVEISATNPAKIFGMYPEKGTIAPGSDADIVIFDPTLQKTINKKILHENVDYTPYEGIQVTGFPVMTFSRGKIIAKDGEFIGQIGSGKFIVRRHPTII